MVKYLIYPIIKCSLDQVPLDKSNLSGTNEQNLTTYIYHNVSSVIDLLFISNSHITEDTVARVYQCAISEHQMVSCEINRSRSLQRKKRIKKLDVNYILEQNVQADMDIESGYSNIVSLLQRAWVEPKYRKSKPWFDRECYDKHKILKNNCDKKGINAEKTI